MNTPEWIIVGLGNPDDEYKTTRHNAGFLCVEHLAKKHGITFDFEQFDAIFGQGVINGKSCILVKPQTYMNRSGIAVEGILDCYELPPERLLVISDDISFGVGRMRIRRNGSAGGQKGLKSIIETIASVQFPRIKIGVGEKPEGFDLGDWVLSDFTEEEQKILDEVLEKASQAVELIIEGSIDAAMGKFN